jgi:hypothetical protein
MRMRVIVFKIGALVVCICAVLLGIAVPTSVFLQRELSGFEVAVAFVAATVFGTCWWLLMHRHMRARG